MPPIGIAWAYILLVGVLVTAALIDLRRGVVPNYLTLPTIIVGLVGHSIVGGFEGNSQSLGLYGALAGLALGFIPMFVAWKMGGVGGGDVKLMAAIGAMTGWRFTLSALLFGLLVAAIMAIFVMTHKKIVKQTLIRVWHCLLLALAVKKTFDPTTAQSPKVPVAVAFCVGAIIALIETLWFASGTLLGL